MAPATELFSRQALRAALGRRLDEADRGGREQTGWSQADLILAADLYTWLGTSEDVTVPLPTNGVAVAGMPELDWSAVTLEQLARATAHVGPRDGPMSRTDLRSAIRRRLTQRDAGAPSSLLEEDGPEARCLLELYVNLGHEAAVPPVEVPIDGTPGGQPEIDWSRISAEELSQRVRRAHGVRDGVGGHEVRAERPGRAARGATVHGPEDETHEPASYASFAQRRARARADQVRLLLEARQRFRHEADAIRDAHFALAQELVADRSMPRSVRAHALRHHRQTLQRELGELGLQRAEALGAGRPWYGKLLERWRDERGDRRDYASVLRALYDDRTSAARAGTDRSAVGLDPALIAIPGLRRHRIGGALVYTRRTLAGEAELFCACEDTREVIVRSRDPIATEAAIVKAYQLDGPPLTFVGSDEFQARCEHIAARRGFAVAPRPGLSDIGAAAAPARATAPAGAVAARSSAQTARGSGPTGTSAGEADPPPDLADYGDIVSFVKEQTGVDYVVALDPEFAVPMEPVYLAHTPMHQGPFDLVFVRKPGVDAISAIVLPRGSVPGHAVGGETPVVLAIEDGRWQARFEASAQALRSDAPANRSSRSRGR